MGIAFTKIYNIERSTTVGTYIQGVYIPSPKASEVIHASIQPLKLFEQNDTLQLTDGRRNKAGIKIYSDELLYSSSQTVKGDIVIYKGRRFEVLKVSDHTDNFLPHFASIALEEEVDKENSK